MDSRTRTYLPPLLRCLLAAAIAGLLGGCLDDEPAPAAQQPPPGSQPPPPPEWSAPVAVAPGGCPIESRDGALLYTAAGPANVDGLDIWVFRADAAAALYDTRTRIGDPVSVDGANDFCPTPLMDDWLMFVSTRAGVDKCGEPGSMPGLTGSDIFVARFAVRPPAATGGALQLESKGPAKRLACYPDGPNTKGTSLSPSLVTSGEGTVLFYSSNHNGLEFTGSQDIYSSQLGPDGSYSTGVPVAALNTTFEDQQPNVSSDGLTIVFASNRDGNMDIFMATRPSLTGAWSTPRNLSMQFTFATAGLAETRPSLSRNGQRLYYGADGQVYLSRKASAN